MESSDFHSYTTINWKDLWKEKQRRQQEKTQDSLLSWQLINAAGDCAGFGEACSPMPAGKALNDEDGGAKGPGTDLLYLLLKILTEIKYNVQF